MSNVHDWVKTGENLKEKTSKLIKVNRSKRLTVKLGQNQFDRKNPNTGGALRRSSSFDRQNALTGKTSITTGLCFGQTSSLNRGFFAIARPVKGAGRAAPRNVG
jgi:hypothetical protein